MSIRTFRLALCSLLVGSACAGPSPASGANASPGATPMHIRVGSHVFPATLEGDAPAQAFARILPLTLNMSDVNANEKYCELPQRLPTNESRPVTIQAGDVMLYGSKGLVLFYETFPTSYSYTRIGKVNDPTGLVAALGAGDVTVTFAL
jgi:hypothetical protein